MTLTLPSNNGNSELSITLLSPSEYADEAGFDSCVKISYKYWDGDHLNPLNLQFAGLWLGRNDLKKAHDYLTTWVHQPLSQLATSVLIAEFELARLPGQSLKLIFGPRKDTIDERKPVLTVKIVVNSFLAEFRFVTDQSCLALFAEDMSKI